MWLSNSQVRSEICTKKIKSIVGDLGVWWHYFISIPEKAYTQQKRRNLPYVYQCLHLCTVTERSMIQAAVKWQVGCLTPAQPLTWTQVFRHRSRPGEAWTPCDSSERHTLHRTNQCRSLSSACKRPIPYPVQRPLVCLSPSLWGPMKISLMWWRNGFVWSEKQWIEIGAGGGEMTFFGSVGGGRAGRGGFVQDVWWGF